MGETDKKDLEEQVEKVIKKGGKGIGSLVQKGIVALLIAVLTWIGSYISSEYQKIRTDWETMTKRVAELEQDKAKWATLADLQEQQLQMRIQLEVMRQTWSYEYGRAVPTGFPSRPGQPELRPPAELFRDVDRYRNMQEQKVAPKK
jgi:hypothetical protein